MADKDPISPGTEAEEGAAGAEPYRPPSQRRALYRATARPGGKYSGDCRRAFPRQRMVRLVEVTELDELGRPAASWTCASSDISRSGMGLRSKRMAFPGRGVLILLGAVGSESSKALYGVVAQSRYSPGEGYVIGVEFESMPDTAEIRAWRTLRGI
jgi:hypothetical protein